MVNRLLHHIKIVEATGSGMNYSATIPPQPAGTALQYRIVTSTTDLSSFVASGSIDSLTLSTSSTFKFIAGGVNLHQHLHLHPHLPYR